MTRAGTEVEQLAEQMPEREVDIYVYMKKVYEDLAAAGEKYDEAKNDTFAEQKASERFGVTTEEAAQIYAKAESQVRRYHLNR